MPATLTMFTIYQPEGGGKAMPITLPFIRDLVDRKKYFVFTEPEPAPKIRRGKAGAQPRRGGREIAQLED